MLISAPRSIRFQGKSYTLFMDNGLWSHDAMGRSDRSGQALKWGCEEMPISVVLACGDRAPTAGAPACSVRIQPFVLYADVSDAKVSQDEVTVWVGDHGTVPPAGCYEGTIQTREGADARVEITVPRPQQVEHVGRRLLDLRLGEGQDAPSVGRSIRLLFQAVLVDGPPPDLQRA